MIQRCWFVLRRLDLGVLIAACLLLSAGVAFIYSAGQFHQGGAGQGLYLRQIVWAAIGLGCFFVFAMADYHIWHRQAWWLYLLAVVLLVAVLVPGVGARIYGARRWLQIAGVRLLQPAEVAKVILVIMLARLLGAPGRNLRRRRLVAVSLALTLLPMLLIAAQPDLGSALVFLPICGAMLFAAGVPARTLWGLAAGVALVLAVVLNLLLVPPALGWSEAEHNRLLEKFGINAYQKNRVMVFLNSNADPLGAGWNKAQSQLAVGSGRLWGKGFCRGTQNLLGFLPHTVAPNDFIFSVIAEETGFMGALVLLGLMAVILGGALRAAWNAPDKSGRLMCVGVAALIFSHVFVNIAMTIGFLPITGLPLPFLSYGGSFMVSVMSALGLVQSVYARRGING